MRGDLSLKSLGDSIPAARAIVVKLMRHGNTVDNIVNELIEAYGAWWGVVVGWSGCVCKMSGCGEWLWGVVVVCGVVVGVK